MKTRFACCLIAGAWLAAGAAPYTAEAPVGALNVKVDARVELISIIYRLAGNPEYSQGRVPAYLKELNRHFGLAQSHPAVLLARKLRQTRGVSYDAPMSLAVHLKDAQSLELRTPLEPWPAGLDSRWRPDELELFLEHARQFARDTKFERFWQAHQSLYEQTEARARQLVESEGHLDWFDRFFGARPGARFHLAPALVNGGSCYGPKFQQGQQEELYCILGVWSCDAEGQPQFTREALPTIIHEFCHSYVNPVIYAHTAELEPAGTNLFAKVQSQMRRMAYGNWTTMMHESVVRAAVVRYLQATEGEAAAQRQIKQEIDRGFVWMRELAELLARYETEREKHRDLAAFMPEIIRFFARTAEKQKAERGGLLSIALRQDEFAQAPGIRN